MRSWLVSVRSTLTSRHHSPHRQTQSHLTHYPGYRDPRRRHHRLPRHRHPHLRLRRPQNHLHLYLDVKLWLLQTVKSSTLVGLKALRLKSRKFLGKNQNAAKSCLFSLSNARGEVE